MFFTKGIYKFFSKDHLNLSSYFGSGLTQTNHNAGPMTGCYVNWFLVN